MGVFCPVPKGRSSPPKSLARFNLVSVSLLGKLPPAKGVVWPAFLGRLPPDVARPTSADALPPTEGALWPKLQGGVPLAEGVAWPMPVHALLPKRGIAGPTLLVAGGVIWRDLIRELTWIADCRHSPKGAIVGPTLPVAGGVPW